MSARGQSLGSDPLPAIGSVGWWPHGAAGPGWRGAVDGHRAPLLLPAEGPAGSPWLVPGPCVPEQDGCWQGLCRQAGRSSVCTRPLQLLHKASSKEQRVQGFELYFVPGHANGSFLSFSG